MYKQNKIFKMKLKLLLVLFLVSFQCYSQVSVGPRHIGRSQNFKKGVLEKFKNTETVFLLSSVYDKEVYEQILKDSWDVTPYRIVDLEDFEIADFLSDKYSFAQLSGFERVYHTKHGGYSSLFTYVDFQMFDQEKIKKKLSKMSDKKKVRKFDELLNENSYAIARFYIFPKDDFLNKAVPYKENETELSLYKDDVFFNYKPGLLKNYFQKINNLIKAEEVYWLYKNDHLPELQNLASSKLYIPAYMLIKYNPFTIKDKDIEEESTHSLLEKYDFDYEIVEDDVLSDRIMKNEEFYYMRYVRMNAERFIQVVNSKTGEIVYRDYVTGLGYNLKPKQINNLNKSIVQASRK